MIVRHNWVSDRAGYSCIYKELAAPRDDANCYGCDANIPREGWWFGWSDSDSSLDRIWHEELRPMAGLCCMVEEADDGPA